MAHPALTACAKGLVRGVTSAVRQDVLAAIEGVREVRNTRLNPVLSADRRSQASALWDALVATGVRDAIEGAAERPMASRWPVLARILEDVASEADWGHVDGGSVT